jgi:hypothetical protein
METIRDLYAAALEEKQTLLKDIIELLVIEKKKMNWSDPLDRIYEFIIPPEGKRQAWNQRYREELARMKAKRERGKVRHG